MKVVLVKIRFCKIMCWFCLVSNYVVIIVRVKGDCVVGIYIVDKLKE